MLDAAYILEAEQRARVFSGAWTGTSGTLAADVIRLLNERRELMGTVTELEDANDTLRAAVRERLEATPADDPKMQGYAAQPTIPSNWILRGEQELKEQRLRGDGLLAEKSETYAEWVPPQYATDNLRPGSREFLAVLEELRSLHLAKTLDYGMDEDALSNIRSSADVVNMPAWAGCILRISDKMHRLKAFFRRGRVEFDGIEDTLKDIACYAAIALVLHRETTKP